ncbi:hypothetical protein IW261DRAFT_1482480 [Armillaria novae-zelandiae]|uniref:Uncharacterized protein n=1 Tax=Armillaria novae-zelandiae TaxID=153914 RepID=A0AA39P6J1_9AGAR|nr:hypothetical protein IW261DRAFT_1482480 [Armillaria novae-zelandiae]
MSLVSPFYRCCRLLLHGLGRVTLPRFPDVLRIRRNPSQKNGPFPVPEPHRRVYKIINLVSPLWHLNPRRTAYSFPKTRLTHRGMTWTCHWTTRRHLFVVSHRPPPGKPSGTTLYAWRKGDLVSVFLPSSTTMPCTEGSIQRGPTTCSSIFPSATNHSASVPPLLRAMKAWRLLDEITAPSGSAPLPVAYWLEFFHSSHRSPLSNTEFLHLMKISPAKLTETTTPRVMSVVARAILRLGRPSYALQLVTSYLTGMPRKVNAVLVRQNTKLINLVVCYGSTEKGIKRFFQSRQTLQTLLALHPTLRPTPATLLILLGQLWRCKRAGSIASQLVEEFKDRWGCSVENAEVRQKVASLALKDVRLRGISPKMLQTIEESASSGSQSGGCGVTGFRYVPHFWSVPGVEERRRWRRLHLLYRRRTRGQGATGGRVSKRSRGEVSGEETGGLIRV